MPINLPVVQSGNVRWTRVDCPPDASVEKIGRQQVDTITDGPEASQLGELIDPMGTYLVGKGSDGIDINEIYLKTSDGVCYKYKKLLSSFGIGLVTFLGGAVVGTGLAGWVATKAAGK